LILITLSIVGRAVLTA